MNGKTETAVFVTAMKNDKNENLYVTEEGDWFLHSGEEIIPINFGRAFSMATEMEQIKAIHKYIDEFKSTIVRKQLDLYLWALTQDLGKTRGPFLSNVVDMTLLKIIEHIKRDSSRFPHF